MAKKPVVIVSMLSTQFSVDTNVEREVLSFILRRVYKCEVKEGSYWPRKGIGVEKERVIGAILDHHLSYAVKGIREIYPDIPIIIVPKYDMEEPPKELTEPGVCLLAADSEELQAQVALWIENYLHGETIEEDEVKVNPRYDEELTRWLSLSPKQRKVIVDSQIQTGTSKGGKVAGFAVCNQTLEYSITGGEGHHYLCIGNVNHRLEVALYFPNGLQALADSEGRYDGQVFFGFILQEVESFSFPPLVLYPEPGDNENNIDSLIDKLRAQGEYLAIAMKDCVDDNS